MITPSFTKFDETFFNQKFANKYLTDKRTLRIGNIISFIGKVDYNIEGKKYFSEQAINWLIEIPEISNYAGVCFQKLFTTNVANLLANKFYKAEVEVKNNDIFILKEHENAGIHQVDGVVSISYIKNVNGAILIHLGLHNNAGCLSHPRSFSLGLSEEIANNFMDMVNESFYHLANSIFLQTAKM